MTVTEPAPPPAPKKKRPRGRPRSPEVARDKVQTWLRSTPKEKLAWSRAAKRAGIPLRTWIRMQCNQAAGAETPATKED